MQKDSPVFWSMIGLNDEPPAPAKASPRNEPVPDGVEIYVSGIETIGGNRVTAEPMGVWMGDSWPLACDLCDEMVGRGWLCVQATWTNKLGEKRIVRW